MSALSQCDLRSRPMGMIRALLLLRVVLLFAAFGLMALMLIALRFETREFQMETARLQKDREDMAGRKNALVYEVECLKRYDYLRTYAEQTLGLRESSLQCATAAVVSADAIDRWGESAREEMGGDVDIVSPRVSRLAALGERLIALSSSVSVARDRL
jgi:cell division protein FtsB